MSSYFLAALISGSHAQSGPGIYISFLKTTVRIILSCHDEAAGYGMRTLLGMKVFLTKSWGKFLE